MRLPRRPYDPPSSSVDRQVWMLGWLVALGVAPGTFLIVLDQYLSNPHHLAGDGTTITMGVLVTMATLNIGFLFWVWFEKAPLLFATKPVD